MFQDLGKSREFYVLEDRHQERLKTLACRGGRLSLGSR